MHGRLEEAQISFGPHPIEERNGVRYIFPQRTIFILYADSQSLLFPLAPCKAMNAGWASPGLRMDDLRLMIVRKSAFLAVRASSAGAKGGSDWAISSRFGRFLRL